MSLARARRTSDLWIDRNRKIVVHRSKPDAERGWHEGIAVMEMRRGVSVHPWWNHGHGYDLVEAGVQPVRHRIQLERLVSA